MPKPRATPSPKPFDLFESITGLRNQINNYPTNVPSILRREKAKWK